MRGDDIMPDLYIGRLPVNKAAELTAMVNRIIAYESDPLPGDWRTRSVFVADNPDAGGQFHVLSDAASTHVPADWSTPKIYLGAAQYPQNQAALAQQAVLDAFNQGSLLFNYVGHASITAWASELLLSASNAGQLRNGAAAPIMLPMTCLEGTYHNPRFAGPSESLVRATGGGALASWGPTGLGVATGHDFMHQGFMDALFKQDTYILGKAIDAGKHNLYDNARFSDGTPRFRDLIDTYVLLGDPASRIGVPRSVDLELSAAISPPPYDPGQTVTYSLNYRNAGQARARDVSIAAQLPAWLTGLTWSATGPQLTETPGSPYTWTLSQLGAGEAGQITITGQIDPAAPASAFPMAALFTATSRGEEVDPADNIAGPLYINLGSADFVLTQEVEPVDTIQPGEQVTITLKYFNFGPAAATGARIDLPLSFPLEQLHLVQSGPSLTIAPDTQYAFDLAAVPPGSGGSLVLTGRIPFGVISQQVQFKIAAKARLSLPDPDLSNNVGGPNMLSIRGADEFEPDDAWFQARPVAVPASRQGHLYEPMGDEDWLVFRAEAGARYLIRAEVENSQHGVALYLRSTAGAFLDSSDGMDNGGVTLLGWTAPVSGDYYLAIAGGALDSGARYTLSIGVLPGRSYLPLMVNN